MVKNTINKIIEVISTSGKKWGCGGADINVADYSSKKQNKFLLKFFFSLGPSACAMFFSELPAPLILRGRKRGTKRLKGALVAFWIAGAAYVPAMVDQSIGQEHPILLWEQRH